MTRGKNYKIEMFGGDLNGAQRYYSTLPIATREAKRYIKRNLEKYYSNSCVYIYAVTGKFPLPLISILDENDI